MSIYVKTKDSEPPIDNHYIVANNGLFLRKINPLMDVVLRVNKIPNLLYQMEEQKFKYPKIDSKEVCMIAGFFYQMYKKFGGESIVLIYWSPKLGYLFDAPSQQVCRETIEYSPRDRFKGYLLVGSIHCHGKLLAYHSSGHKFSDNEDEVDFDGLHITFGNINANIMTISVSVMVNGRRFMLNPLKYLGGIEEVKIIKNLPPPPIKPIDIYDYQKPPAWWSGGFRKEQYEEDGLYQGPYWAPCTGKKNWELLLPFGQKSVVKNEQVYSRSQRIVYGLQRIFRGQSASVVPVEEPEKAELLGNPFDNKIPFFFRLGLPANEGIESLCFPKVWEEKVSKMPYIERVKNGLTYLGELINYAN